MFPAAVLVSPVDDPALSTTSALPPSSAAVKEDGLRVVVTNDALFIFRDAAPGPQTVFYERLDSFTPAPRRHSDFRAVTASGKLVTFRSSGGCGCGSRLRAFNPFPMMMESTR